MGNFNRENPSGKFKKQRERIALLISYFAADDINLSYFIDAAEDFDSDVLPETLRADLLDRIKRAHMISELTKYSLMKYDRKNKTLSIHRILQEVIRDTLNGDAKYIKCCFDMMCRLGTKTIVEKEEEAFYNMLPNIHFILGYSESLLAQDVDFKKNVWIIYDFIGRISSFINIREVRTISSFYKSMASYKEACGEILWELKSMLRYLLAVSGSE